LLEISLASSLNLPILSALDFLEGPPEAGDIFLVGGGLYPCGRYRADLTPPCVEVWILLGWLGADIVLLVIKVVLVLLDLEMALVPNLGKELVLCCLVEGNPDIVIEVVEEGIVRGGGECGGESSDSLAKTVVSGTLLRLPYLLLILLRTELEILPDASSESLSCVLNLVDNSEVGVVLNSEFLVMSFSDLDMWSELRELGRDDFRDLLED